ncbi:DUF1778 domain-containing protein [Methylovulum psychrotolerans]|uniref:type II toxin-antitoxin system TacA family antitoxin n=1 Tax=Methylovulum psychrotolerans TaxID=1704499 RepID=UPI001BFF90CD|nr:DUF1778 domain-containing protein [Methylovulum psychrotolerans]MBT9097163.1 DUF1778 domain-containing protein [Methylovulum psychrotolerans]
MTDFVVAAACEAAQQTIEFIHLSVDDQWWFAESTINPPEPTAALRRAFEKHHKLFGIK